MTVKKTDKGQIWVEGICGAYTFLTSTKKKYKSEEKEYTAKLIVDGATGKAFEKLLVDARTAKIKKLKEDGKKVTPGEIYKIKPLGETNDDGDFIADPSGNYEIKIQLDEKNKQGVKQKLIILDSNATVKKDPPAIGEGSKVSVCFLPNTFEMAGQVKVSPKPLAVQVIELVEFGGVSVEDIVSCAGTYEGGYTGDDDEESTDEENISETEEDSQANF